MSPRALRGLRSSTVGVTAAVAAAACHAPVPARAVTSPAPLAGPVVVAASLDGRVLLAEVSTRAIEAGAGPLSIVATGEAAERERIGAFVEVPETACLLAYARASASVEDLDLAAFTDDGTPVAVDDAPDPHPTLLVCPPHPSRIYVAAVAASGEGLVGVGAHLVPVALAAVVGKALNAHGTRAASSRAAEAWPGLEDHVRRHHDLVGGTWEVFRKVAVAVDARVPAQVAFPLDADGCTDALVVPDDDVGGLEVEALDDRGRLVARGAPGDRDRGLTVCGSAGWTGSLSVRPHVGQGLVAVVLSRGRADAVKGLGVTPDIAWSAATEPVERVRGALEAELRKGGYDAARGVESGRAAVGAVSSVPLRLTLEGARACTRIDVLGGAPIALVSASAWDVAGSRVAAADGPSAAALFACGAGAVRLDVEAHARPGPFAVVWRSEPWTDALFATHPTAAARMLTRALLGAEPQKAPTLAGTAIGVRAFRLEAWHEASWNEVVPAGACEQVVAGAEGDGAGLVARATDATTGAEIDRAHAAAAVALRACAPADGARAVRVSLVVTGGKLDVVVGARLLR